MTSSKITEYVPLTIQQEKIPEHVDQDNGFWEMDEALRLVRLLQPETRQFNYHLALAGGVLNRGWSAKDLDLVFLPLDNETAPNPRGLIDMLSSMWGTPAELGAAYGRAPRSRYQSKLKYYYGGLRIDVFVIAPEGDLNRG